MAAYKSKGRTWEQVLSPQTGEGFAFACWIRLSAQYYGWVLVAKNLPLRNHGWGCAMCQMDWVGLKDRSR